MTVRPGRRLPRQSTVGIHLLALQVRRTAVVPKRALATAGELVAPRQLLRDKLGKTARLAGCEASPLSRHGSLPTPVGGVAYVGG